MKTFGVNSNDGTLTLCKAKPENRGKGRCSHFEHVDLDGPESSPEVIKKYNEEKLSEYFGGDFFSFRQGEPTIESPSGGTFLKPEEFHEATNGLNTAFTQESWELLQNFYSDFSLMVMQSERLEHERHQIVDRLSSYIDSDDPVAKNIRDFLGPEVNSNTFATILVNGVKSMTASISPSNSKRRDNMNRVVTTSCANDMTRKRYIASVLFFAGRCCYCNCVMNKIPGDPKQATGEHLTPTSPDKENSPRGVTRYGNMALACLRCNSQRKNSDLDEWIDKTELIPEDEKEKTRNRIQAFRKFTLYEEYSIQKSDEIGRVISELREKEHNVPRNTNTKNKIAVFEEKEYLEFKDEVKIKLFDLNQFLKE